MSFDGGDWLQIGGISDGDWTIYFVCKPASSGNRSIFGSHSSNAPQLRLNNSSKWEWVSSGAFVIATSSTAVSTSAYSYVTVTRSASSNGKFRLNGVDDGNTGTQANLSNQIQEIGSQGTGAIEQWQTFIAEIVRFPSKHNSTDIASMESYLTTKYGL